VTQLYEGWVRHRRFVAPARSFRHRVFMTLSDGPVRTLELPPSLGVAFNPVRFHFEMHGDELRSIAAEVTNTPWGERRTYRFEDRGGEVAKDMHVSPFLALDGDYVLRATAPGDRLTIQIEARQGGERVFDATLSLARRPARDQLRLRLRYPLQTLRVLALIYVHAARLVLRGARYYPHPNRRQTQS